MSSIDLEQALGGMILSTSGWRGVFAEDGDEESASPKISEAHRIIAAGAACCFADFLNEAGAAGPIIVGMDTRPTGKAIADVIVRTLLTKKREVLFPGVVAAPEIMAYARSLGKTGGAAGFIFISASHNPIGHNGLKFGLCDGGVLPGEQAARLTARFRALMAADDGLHAKSILMDPAQAAPIKAVQARQPQVKSEALAAYREFTGTVITGFEDAGKAAAAMEAIREGIRRKPLGICADFNGSARTVSIDREYLTGLGVLFKGINEKPGEIVHAIVPEGDNLETCRFLVGESHLEDRITVLGYVPDCDGDRGNLIIWDDGEQYGRILEAQEVFALSCVAELSYLVWTGELHYDNNGNALSKAAVAVNDPTSGRIDRIARAFDIPVFRAEVGEANVVGLARRLREKGYIVRVLGEGSAGGTIIHPSAVRDPMDTVGAILKLLTIRSRDGRPGLFELWCALSGQTETYREDFSLSDVIASLPAYITTGAYTPEAKLRVVTTDHRLLKERYQEVFLREWERRRKELLERCGISRWEAAVYNGMEEKRGVSSFGEAGTGGLKIDFINVDGRKSASIWMRGSGTEPVFRVMADVEGSDRRFERDLIDWQRRMVLAADRGA